MPYEELLALDAVMQELSAGFPYLLEDHHDHPEFHTTCLTGRIFGVSTFRGKLMDGKVFYVEHDQSPLIVKNQSELDESAN